MVNLDRSRTRERGEYNREVFMAHILVVEDSRTQAQEIQLLLEDAGFAVTLAGQGREAMAALRRAPCRTWC